MVLPSDLAIAHEAARARVVERPGREVDVVGSVADVLRASPPICCGSPASGAQRALGLAGGARRVDHRRAGLVGRRPGSDVRRRLGQQRIAVEHAGPAPRRRTRGSSRPSGSSARMRLEERGELGVDVDDRGVAVVDDVGRLLVGRAGS